MTNNTSPASRPASAPVSSAPAGAPVSGTPAGAPVSSSAPASNSAAVSSPQARFEFLPAGECEPATVRAAGDIDLTNVDQFQAALDQAVAASDTVIADMTEVTYCDSAAVRALFVTARRARLTIQISTTGPINETLLEVSGLDQVATVVTLH